MFKQQCNNAYHYHIDFSYKTSHCIQYCNICVPHLNLSIIKVSIISNTLSIMVILSIQERKVEINFVLIKMRKKDHYNDKYNETYNT